MADSLSTIGSIAIHIDQTLDITNAVSGNMVTIVDMSRQHVANFTGAVIGSNSINAKYQPAIVNFAFADAVDMQSAQAGGEKIRLAELSIDDSGDQLSAKQYRIIAENSLSTLGRTYHINRSIS